MTVQATGREPLTDAEMQFLEDFLARLPSPDALTVEGMDGLFCALLAGPTSFMPSAYLPLVWGVQSPDEPVFQDLTEANTVLPLIMRHWNSIIADIDRDGIHPPLVEDAPDERGILGRDWARGFMRGVDLDRPGWMSLFGDENEGALFMIPVVAGETDEDWPHKVYSDKEADEVLMFMAAGFTRAYRHFAEARRAGAEAPRHGTTFRRATVKVGRNDPCPCGSGRKYKHCCASSELGTTH